MRLNIVASPSPRVVVTRYTASAFPKFSHMFERQPESSPLRVLARGPEEAELAVVLENRSEKDISALRYRWHMVDDHGDDRTHIHSADSYFVEVYRPIAEPGSRHLLTESGSVDEALIDHVQAGGGLIAVGAGARSRQDRAFPATDATFTIDFLLFADGEIAGDDPDRYGQELRCRKPAAEFVAKQIRLAEAEKRDVTPVLSAFIDLPRLGSKHQPPSDPILHWTRRYAADYLRDKDRKIGEIGMREAKLRHFESRPALPKFYRREQ